MSRTHLHTIARQSRLQTKKATVEHRLAAAAGQAPDFSARATESPLCLDRHGNRRRDIAKEKRRLVRAVRKQQIQDARVDPDRPTPSRKKRP